MADSGWPGAAQTSRTAAGWDTRILLGFLEACQAKQNAASPGSPGAKAGLIHGACHRVWLKRSSRPFPHSHSPVAQPRTRAGAHPSPVLAHTRGTAWGSCFRAALGMPCWKVPAVLLRSGSVLGCRCSPRLSEEPFCSEFIWGLYLCGAEPRFRGVRDTQSLPCARGRAWGVTVRCLHCPCVSVPGWSSRSVLVTRPPGSGRTSGTAQGQQGEEGNAFQLFLS